MTFCWRGNWQGMVLVEDTLIPNEWEFSIYFASSNNNDPVKEQIALDRCRFLVENIFQDSLWMHIDDPWAKTFHEKMKGHIITLPVLPFDNAIAIATLSKCISVSEDMLDFFQITLSSRLGEGIELTIDASDLLEIDWLSNNSVYDLTKEHAWYMRTNPGTTDILLKNDSTIEVVRDMLDWEQYDLSWEQNPKIIFTQEGTKPTVTSAPMANPGKTVWKPVVIDGGKNNEG